MKQLFESEDFRLFLTGHDYDFVGIIETKGDEPLTFFFEEEYFPCNEDDEEDFDGDDYDAIINEEQTTLLDVYKGLKTEDEEDDISMDLCATSYFRTRDDKSTGLLSDPKERGQFLAIVKAFCPEKLKEIPWA